MKFENNFYKVIISKYEKKEHRFIAKDNLF